MVRHLHLPRARRIGAAAATSILVVTATLTAGPAWSAPAPGCPATVAPADLTPGQAVTGSTVLQGTTPSTFTGTVQGVLEDGIAPGVDMILADLDSPNIARTGIFSGMSGSPVYDADGGLIGAVSYSLGLGPSTVAGITPAPEMAKLLGSPSARSSARSAGAAKLVALPKALQQRVVGSGSASAKEASQGLARLRIPVSLSGLSGDRAQQLTGVLNRTGRSFAAGTAAPTSTDPIPVEAGGNLASSLSYGTVTAAGLGTATLVCGDQVVGFGHPMEFSGPATMNMHGADAILIQDDSTVSGFKVANLGAPVGTIDGDHLVGISGRTGQTLTGVPISARAVYGTSSYDALTHVTVPDYTPDLALSNIFAAQDRALDRTGQGSALASWTIKGKRKDGRPFSLTRADRYASPNDISSEPAFELGEELYELQENEGEAITFTSIDSTTSFTDDADTYAVAWVQSWFRGAWHTASANTPLRAWAGTDAKLRILLTSRTAETRKVFTQVAIPDRAAGRQGTLVADAADSGGGGFGEFEDDFGDAYGQAPSSSTLPALIKSIETRQRNDQVRVTSTFRGLGGSDPTNTRRVNAKVGSVVSGGVQVRLVAVP